MIPRRRDPIGLYLHIPFATANVPTAIFIPCLPAAGRWTITAAV